jgi:exodeoxyribonuclease VII large subunit
MSELLRERPVLKPSQLNALARDLLEGSFSQVWVQGEISNFSRPASGHLYFTLKDDRAQVRCALFRQKAMYLRFAPKDGALVLVRGKATLYEARGEHQLILEHMEEAGEGALRVAFEALKQRLSAEGLFAAERKRALPRLVRRLGLITSPSGAAVRDVLSVTARRFPMLEVDVLPVAVQGTGAAAVRSRTCGASTTSRWPGRSPPRRSRSCPRSATRSISPWPTSLPTGARRRPRPRPNCWCLTRPSCPPS